MAWSLFLGLCLSGGVAFVTIFGSMGLAPISMVTWIFLLGIPFGIVHYKLCGDSADGGGINATRAETSAVASLAQSSPEESSVQRTGEPLPGAKPVQLTELDHAVVERSWSLVLLMVAITAVVEIVMPPRSDTFMTKSFSGHSVACTLYSRGIFTTESQPDAIDLRILITEIGLVGGAFALSYRALTNREKHPPAVTASRISSNAAIVLHGAAWLLPLAQAGMDTISFIDFPHVAILLVPNIFSTLAAVRISKEEPTRDHFPRVALRRRIVLDRMLAVTWGLVMLLSMMGLDFKGPMGGPALVTMAFWFSARAGRYLNHHLSGQDGPNPSPASCPPSLPSAEAP